MPQVISDNPVHVRQVQRRISLSDGVWFGSVIELTDHNVEQDLGVTHPDDPMFVDTKRDGVGLDGQRNDRCLLVLFFSGA